MSKAIKNSMHIMAIIGLCIMILGPIYVLLGLPKDLSMDVKKNYAFYFIGLWYVFFIPSIIYYSSIVEANIEMLFLNSVFIILFLDFLDRVVNVDVNIKLFFILPLLQLLVSSIIFFVNEITKNERIKILMNTKVCLLLDNKKQKGRILS